MQECKEWFIDPNSTRAIAVFQQPSGLLFLHSKLLIWVVSGRSILMVTSGASLGLNLVSFLCENLQRNVDLHGMFGWELNFSL